MHWRPWRTVAAVIIFVFAAFAGLLVFRAIGQHAIVRADRYGSPPGIDLLEKIQLGGVAQWIQIRGHDRTRPLLLIVHGGPGLPDMPYAYVNSALENDFVVVQWDQRGAGKSFDAKTPAASMNLAQLVSDARELSLHLCRRFEQKQIFLAGHSSGSIVGMMLIAETPELFRAYVGISQIANLQESEKRLYAFAREAAAERNDRKAGEELKRIGLPPFSDAKALQVSQKWVNAFAPDRFGALSYERLQLAFFSPAYSLFDLVRLLRGAKFSFDHLWRELFAVDLFQQIPEVKVPVYFFIGRDDHVVTGAVAEQYFQKLIAPRGKQLIWFEKSAHWPQLNEPEKFRREMVERVLKENL